MFLLNYVGTVWETWDFAAADAVGPRGTAAAPLVCARASSMCARLVHVHVLVLK